jgi:hypothetical protein
VPSSSDISLDLKQSATWLREQPSRRIAAIVFLDAEQHWAAILINGRGNIKVADSLTVTALPGWWYDCEGAWKIFFELVDDAIQIQASVVDFGHQSDGSNCGPAALSAVRRFIDPTAPIWTDGEARLARLRLVFNIAGVQTVSRQDEVPKAMIDFNQASFLQEYPYAFKLRQDVMLSLPRSEKAVDRSGSPEYEDLAILETSSIRP